MMKKPIVWSIAGIDPSGLAGTYVDLETLKQFNVQACGIIAAVTAQNASEVTSIEAITPNHLLTQCQTLHHQFKPDALKIGMLGSMDSHECLIQFLTHYSGFVVLDPIIHASSGNSLIFTQEQQHIRSLINLFPYVDVLTPNRLEAEKILKRTLTSYQDIKNAAHSLIDLGAKSVLLKGGHVHDNLLSQDYWTNGQESFWLASPRLPEKNYRGTGCTLSSALAACIALGHSLKDALVIAKMYVNQGMRQAFEIKPNTAKLFHGAWPENSMDLPYLVNQPLMALPKAFKPCHMQLYPVVDRSHWLEKLLPLGVKRIQLRIKDLQNKPLEEEIKRSIFLAKKYKATLFINDYWEQALHYHAQGVHLGQEDLATADVEQIHKSGLYLGLSTHCYYEVARAHAHNPSYIACGPIYPTTSKSMSFKPQGIEQLKRWGKTLQYPLVAIGGITLKRLPEVLATGVEGISLISAITKSADPCKVTREFLTIIDGYKYA